MKNYLKLIIAIIICQLAGFIGSIFTTSSINNWYQTLLRPSFAPPNYLFAPVWTFLFLLMGISLYLILNKKKMYKFALSLFSIQLLLNILWSFFFFGLKNPLFAFIEIIILWIFILLTIIYFYKIDKLASYLLIPYLAWVSFAAILNYSFYILNI